MPIDYKFRRAGLVDSHVFKGMNVPTGAAAAGVVANAIIHSATETDYIVYNAGGDVLVYA